MRTFRWTKALLLTFLAGTALPACSTIDTIIPENMQFWSGVSSFSEDSPNLANTPSDEEIKKARDGADALRKQLEDDRDRSRRIAMGIPLPQDIADSQSLLNDSNYLTLTQTQRALWLRRDGVMGENTIPQAAKITEEELPAEMFVPQNVVINYDVIPEAQYQPPLYATQAIDYVQMGGSITTNPPQPSDLINSAPMESEYKIDVPSVAPVSLGNDQADGLIFFEYGSATLNDNDMKFLKETAEIIKKTVGPVRVVGHASAKVAADNPTQGRAKNLMMSDKRAAAVMKALVSFGVDKDRIEVSAFGDSMPIFPIDGKTPEEADRRVEIYIGAEQPAG